MRTTETVSSENVSMLKNYQSNSGVCNEGFELNSTGHCQECPIGYYKPFEELPTGNGCQLCPIDRVTLGTGSISIGNCDVGKLSELVEYVAALCQLTRRLELTLKH